MQNISTVLQSPNVCQKIETNSTLQLDNPVISKKDVKLNNTRNLSRKRCSTFANVPSPEFIHNLQNASFEYQKLASQRYVFLFFNGISKYF